MSEVFLAESTEKAETAEKAISIGLLCLLCLLCVLGEKHFMPSHRERGNESPGQRRA